MPGPHPKKEKTIVCHDRHGKLIRVAASKVKFRPSVYAVIIKGNKILLSRQWDGYDFPGGGVKIGETIEQALKREVWEETGLGIKMHEVVETGQSFYYAAQEKEYWHTFYIYYLCKVVGGKISTVNFDEYEKIYAGAADWFDTNQAKKFKFYNGADSPKIIEKASRMLRKNRGKR